jgi:hypothetical protein
MATNANNPANDDDVGGAGNQGQQQSGGDDAGHHDHREALAGGTKTADLDLPYSTPSDDLFANWKEAGTIIEGLEVHARQLDRAAAMLRAIKETIAHDYDEVDFEMGGDYILMTGPADVINSLIAEGILTDDSKDEKEVEAEDDAETEAEAE